MAMVQQRNRILKRTFNNVATPAQSFATAVSFARAVDRMAKRRRLADGSAASTLASPSAPLTGEHDVKTDYRKRRYSKRRRRVMRRRRKWRKRIVRVVRERTLGTSHIIRHSFAAGVGSNADQSRSVSYTMYGLNGEINPNVNTTNDIGQSLFEASNADWNNWSSTTLSAVNHKVYSYHATLELTMHNTSTTTDALVEVYYIRARRRVESFWSSPNNMYEKGFNRQGPVKEPDTGAQIGAQLSSTGLGVTPFQNALFCRNWNIYKRQKYRIPAGGEASFILTDRRYRVFSVEGTKPYAWDKSTSGVLIQFQGVSTAGEFPSPAAPTELTFNVTRRYRFKLARDDTPGDGIN